VSSPHAKQFMSDELEIDEEVLEEKIDIKPCDQCERKSRKSFRRPINGSLKVF